MAATATTTSWSTWCRACGARAWTTRGCDGCWLKIRLARSCSLKWGAPIWPPKPPSLGSAPAEPWRSSMARSATHARRLRVVRRLQVRGRREPLHRDLELPATTPHERRVDAVRMRDVAHPHRATERVTVGAGGDPSHEDTVAVDRLVAEQERLGIVEREHDQAACQGLRALPQQRLASDKPLFLEGHREPQTSLERRVVAAEIVTPGAVALLHPQRVHRVVAGVTQPELLARRDHVVVDAGCELRRHVELPPQLAHVGNARGPRHGIADLDLSGRPERKRRVRHVGAAETRQQLA